MSLIMDSFRSKKLKLLLKTILFMMLIAISLFFSNEYISNYFVLFNLNSIEAPAVDSRVIVFAPHCDDETLGCAEFIKKTIKNGGQVKVVFITKGVCWGLTPKQLGHYSDNYN